MDLKINKNALPMAKHPKVLGLTLDPKLIYSAHNRNISVHPHKPLQITKALTATGWGKQTESLMASWNAALRTATGCTQDTILQHLHDETLTRPIHEHLQLHASQYKHKTEHPSQPLHKHTTYTPRLENTIFNNGHYTTNIPTDPHTVTTTDINTNMPIYIHILSLCI